MKRSYYKINVFGSQIGSHSNSLKTKTLIVEDLEGLRVVPPVLITIYNLLIYNI